MALDDIERDDSIRVIVLTGAGTAFCAGADLKGANNNLQSRDEEQARATHLEFTKRFGQVLSRLESFAKPVICMVNGVTVAAGLEILLCCDFVIALDGVRIGDGHARYGLIPGGGSTARLPRRVGVSMAKLLIFSGDLVPAQELISCGLVQKVVSADLFEAEVAALCSKLASRSPLALRRAKRLVDEGLQSSLVVALRSELEMNGIHSTSNDRREGLAAFAQHRAPVFTGH